MFNTKIEVKELQHIKLGCKGMHLLPVDFYGW